tara:strand:- start:370 stop:795 length:426 start_codon:yes stop_codon:yes gene_type:complete
MIEYNYTESLYMSQEWSFYIIYNRTSTYAGVSPDPVRRLRQHNGEIKGGAKYTTSKGPGWKHICIITGFKDKIQAMQFEWAVKHVAPRNAGGITNRIKKLYEVLQRKHWTSKSPLASDVPLKIVWHEDNPCKDIVLPEYVS